MTYFYTNLNYLNLFNITEDPTESHDLKERMPGALAVPRCKFESVMGTAEAGTAERRRADSSVPGSAEVRRELRREKPGAVASRSAISRNSSDG